MKHWDKINYIAWAAGQAWRADRSCPACHSNNTGLVKRKALVTSLYQCHNCALLFRVPKSTLEANRRFYQKQYSQGLTTECPDPATLAQLIARGFRGSGKDFTTYIDVLRAIDVQPGHIIFDYGSS
jgi:hypothetical protein